MYSLRLMIEVDIPRVIEVAHYSYQHSRYSDLTFDEDGLKSMFNMSLSADNAQVFVVTNESGLIIGALGAIVVKTPWFKELFSSELFFAIDPPHRGLVPALLLLRAYKNWATMRGANVLNVLADHSRRDERTAKLYERVGFVPNGYALQMRIKP